MCVVLYTGYDNEYKNYFLDFLKETNIEHSEEKCYLGFKITVYADEEDLKILIKRIIEYILEYQLKDAVFSKIYDEYGCLDANDACNVLDLLVNRAVNSNIYEHIKSIIFEKEAIHVDNYVLFNIRFIMLTIYEMVDDICTNLTYRKQRNAFLSMLRTYAALSNISSKKADVEFVSELHCNVSLDNDEPVKLNSDKLLSFLTSRAPLNVNVTGREHSPLLCDIINELFNTNDTI